MPSRSLSVLGFITAAAIIACYLLINDRSQSAVWGKPGESMVFPGLEQQLAEVVDIEVTRSNGQFVLSRRDGIWINNGAGGFPAIQVRVDRALSAIARLKYSEPKTRRSELYSKLGVDDVNAQMNSESSFKADSKSTRLTVKNAVGAVLADVIIGNPKDSVYKGVGEHGSLYIRLPENELSWLAEGAVDARFDALEWSETQVTDFAADSLLALTVSHSQGEVVELHRKQSNDRKLTLKHLPDGSKIEHQYQIDFMAGLLQQLSFADIRRNDSVDFPIFEAIVETNLGVIVKLQIDETLPDGSAWARVDAQLKNDTKSSALAEQEVNRIQSTFSGWQIRLPRKFTDRVKIKLSDILSSQQLIKTTNAYSVRVGGGD